MNPAHCSMAASHIFFFFACCFNWPLATDQVYFFHRCCCRHQEAQCGAVHVHLECGHTPGSTHWHHCHYTYGECKQHWTVLYCTVQSIVYIAILNLLHCTAMNHIALQFTTRNCTAVQCTVLVPAVHLISTCNALIWYLQCTVLVPVVHCPGTCSALSWYL